MQMELNRQTWAVYPALGVVCFKEKPEMGKISHNEKEEAKDKSLENFHI